MAVLDHGGRLFQVRRNPAPTDAAPLRYVHCDNVILARYDHRDGELLLRRTAEQVEAIIAENGPLPIAELVVHFPSVGRYKFRNVQVITPICGEAVEARRPMHRRILDWVVGRR